MLVIVALLLKVHNVMIRLVNADVNQALVVVNVIVVYQVTGTIRRKAVHVSVIESILD